MPEAGEFMRHRHDDTVEVFELVGNRQETAEVLDADLDRNQDPVVPAIGKSARHSTGRFHLLDRIADDNVEPGGSGQI
jgi:hypothetical protein